MNFALSMWQAALVAYVLGLVMGGGAALGLLAWLGRDLVIVEGDQTSARSATPEAGARKYEGQA